MCLESESKFPCGKRNTSSCFRDATLACTRLFCGGAGDTAENWMLAWSSWY